MKKVVFIIIMLLALVACGGQSIEQAIVGKWVASGTDEAFNTYEFYEDGTGFLSTPDGSFNVDFTWRMADESTLVLNIDGNGDVNVAVSMADENRLTFQPETSEEPVNLRRADE